MRRSAPFAFLWRLPRGLLIGIVCALLIAGIWMQLDLLDGAERATLDRLFQARGTRAPDPRVTLLVVDDATVSRVGQWPLPRSLYAQAIQQLTRAGARTIAVDVLFTVPSYSPVQDAQLVRACRQSGRVVQGAAFNVTNPQVYNPVVPVTLLADRRPLPARFAVKDLGASCLSASWVSSALPALQDSAPTLGYINIHPELDGTLRRVPHLIRYRDHVYPSLALAAAAHFMGLKADDIVADAHAVSMASRQGGVYRVPLDSNGEAWINWVGGNRSFPTYSFNQLFDGQIPPVALKDRLVVIGVTAAGAFEHRSTPFSPVQPAVEAQANAISDLLSNRPLHEGTVWWQIALIFGFAILVGVLTFPHRVLGATLWLVCLVFALWWGGVWALSHDFYMPVFAPALGGILAYIVALAMNYRREWESNWRTDASVAALARGGALMSSGRERELLMSVIRRTAGEVLQAREVFLVLDGYDPPEGASASQNGEPPNADAMRFPTLGQAARRVAELGHVVLWSQGMTASSGESASRNGHSNLHRAHEAPGETLAPVRPDPVLRGALEQLSNEVAATHKRANATSRGAFNSILAAPLPQAENSEEEGETFPHSKGVLMAAGRRDGQVFSERDAVLFQTLAEQASLALDNLEYYEKLRGRVELANRNLRQAYQVLSEERANLSEERTKLAAAVESMESALLICDENDLSVFDNGMGTSVLREAMPALGESAPSALSLRGLPEIAALFETIKAKEADAPKATIEMMRLIERGEDQPPLRNILAAQLTPLIAADGRKLGSMLVVTDVTAERELEQMKSDFVAFVAHELRTPLTSIGGFATLLKMDMASFSEELREEMLTSITDQCSRLNRIVSDLLEVARLDPGHQIEVRQQAFDLATLCRKVVTQQRVAIPANQQLTIEMHCNARPIWGNLDPDRIEQVLFNLLSNAIKYSPDGGKVVLDLEQQGEIITLQVRDTGMGMTAEQVANLFQKYYRAPNAQSRGIKGTGLGLYLVKHLVEAQDGQIEVSSELGQGTTFSITLPAAEPA